VIRFTCSNCDKALRTDDDKAGSSVKCPACGHKVTIAEAEAELPTPEDEEQERPAPTNKKRSEAEAELPTPEDEEQEQPAPTKKKKRSRSRVRHKNPAASQGKTFVIIICCIVLGMHLVSLINYLAAPDPMEMAKKQTQEAYQKLGKDMPKDFEQKWEKEFDKVVGGKEMQDALRRSRIISLTWMLGSFSLSAVLLGFLYMRHDWARVVLGVLFLIGAVLGLIGLVFGGLAVLRYLSTGAAILAVLEMLVRLGVSTGIGIALMGSESIAAYTGRR
jgi:DNA-directed RNA polymerase subunit RPC12/RpoP